MVKIKDAITDAFENAIGYGYDGGSSAVDYIILAKSLVDLAEGGVKAVPSEYLEQSFSNIQRYSTPLSYDTWR